MSGFSIFLHLEEHLSNFGVSCQYDGVIRSNFDSSLGNIMGNFNSFDKLFCCNIGQDLGSYQVHQLGVFINLISGKHGNPKWNSSSLRRPRRFAAILDFSSSVTLLENRENIFNSGTRYHLCLLNVFKASSAIVSLIVLNWINSLLNKSFSNQFRFYVGILSLSCSEFLSGCRLKFLNRHH